MRHTPAARQHGNLLTEDVHALRLTSLVCACPLQSVLGAAQLSWFLNDLARINRAVTPWVIVAWHAPAVSVHNVMYACPA